MLPRCCRAKLDARLSRDIQRRILASPRETSRVRRLNDTGRMSSPVGGPNATSLPIPREPRSLTGSDVGRRGSFDGTSGCSSFSESAVEPVSGGIRVVLTALVAKVSPQSTRPGADAGATFLGPIVAGCARSAIRRRDLRSQQTRLRLHHVGRGGGGQTGDSCRSGGDACSDGRDSQACPDYCAALLRRWTHRADGPARKHRRDSCGSTGAARRTAVARPWLFGSEIGGGPHAECVSVPGEQGGRVSPHVCAHVLLPRLQAFSRCDQVAYDGDAPAH